MSNEMMISLSEKSNDLASYKAADLEGNAKIKHRLHHRHKCKERPIYCQAGQDWGTCLF